MIDHLKDTPMPRTANDGMAPGIRRLDTLAEINVGSASAIASADSRNKLGLVWPDSCFKNYRSKAKDQLRNRPNFKNILGAY